MSNQQDKTKKQADKFKKTARDLECDESEERFEKSLRKVSGPRKPAKD